MKKIFFTLVVLAILSDSGNAQLKFSCDRTTERSTTKGFTILNYGFRCVFDKNFKNTSFIPIANTSCMMG